MRRLKIGPAFGQFSIHNAPDDDAGELDLMAGAGIGAAPGISHHYLVAFGNDVFDGDVDIGILLKCRGKIDLWAFRTVGQTGWNGLAPKIETNG